MYNAGDSQAERSCSIIKPPSSYNEGQERHQNSDDCAITKSPLSKMEEQKKHILPPDSSTSTEEADGKTGHERSSEKKRKRKHSRKKSKSRRHSKRSKLSHPQYDDGEDKVNVSRIRDKIPKDLSVRHEATQKKELRDGNKRFKSKRFKKIMLSELAPHQVRVTSWMVKREREPLRQACGGIIAYEMGLGKTVMSLACIAAHRLRKKERKISCQATLVIVPSSTMATQWLGEAEKHWHADASSRVAIYNSANRGLKFAKQLIVLATYAQLRHEFPKKEQMKILESQYEDDNEAYAQEFKNKAGFLFQINWFRVILDEAHSITRWAGRTFQACCAIKAQHRWALTGTPISNNVLEFYPYAVFTKCAFIGSRRLFQKEYIDKGLTTDDFDTPLSYLMYRGTADKSLNIPKTVVQDISVTTSLEEEVLCRCHISEYKEAKEKAAMPIYEREQDENETRKVEPTKKRLWRPIEATKQLRIRQALSHPYCLENFLMGSEYLDGQEVRELVLGLEEIRGKKSIIEHLEADDGWKASLGQYDVGIDALKDRDEPFFGGVFDMSKILDMVLLQHALQESECGKNNCSSQDLVRFKCGHIYCRACLFELMAQSSNQLDGQRTSALKCSVSSCGQDLLGRQPVVTLEMMAAKAIKNKTSVELGKDVLNNTVRPRAEEPLFFMADSSGPRFIPPPNTRVTATMAVAMTWLSEAPQDKMIIFTQFIPTLKILGYFFRYLGVRFIYFSGTLSKQQQEQAINAFRTDPTVMIMISTLKSGGQAHNLTVANRVILVDPWWNKTAEKQAIGRVVRMGQKKKTYAVRIITNHRIDDRVLHLQRTKEITVARMLQDDGHERFHVDDKRLADLFKPKVMEEKKKEKKSKKQSLTFE
ncbi:P-loop containing nucleoside triphosphate hydrolase protein [Trichoderma asperelloides]|nr:P-loop containing nucleoside triphosphate hydrolase protein [Trichoderma asperelloides]